MMQQPEAQGVHRYVGKALVSSDGEKIGNIREFINNRLSGVPTWVAVDAGILSSKRFLVPLAGASFDEDAVIVPYTRQVIDAEPEIVDNGALTPEGESILNTHFGLGSEGTADLSPPNAPQP